MAADMANKRTEMNELALARRVAAGAPADNGHGELRRHWGKLCATSGELSVGFCNSPWRPRFCCIPALGDTLVSSERRKSGHVVCSTIVGAWFG